MNVKVRSPRTESEGFVGSNPTSRTKSHFLFGQYRLPEGYSAFALHCTISHRLQSSSETPLRVQGSSEKRRLPGRLRSGVMRRGYGGVRRRGHVYASDRGHDLWSHRGSRMEQLDHLPLTSSPSD